MPGMYWCLTNHHGRPWRFGAVGAGALIWAAATETWATDANSTMAATMSLFMASSLDPDPDRYAAESRSSGQACQRGGRVSSGDRGRRGKTGATASRGGRAPVPG